MLRTRLQKHRKIAAMSAIGFVGDHPLFLMDVLLRFARVAVLLSVWRVILASRGAVGGMTMGSVLTYTLIAEIFAEQLDCRAGLDDAFWNGTIATHYLQPLGLFEQFGAMMAGRWAFGFAVVSIPLLLLSPFLGVNPLPAGPAAAAWFPISLLLAVSIGLALEFLFAAVMVRMEIAVWTLDSLRGAVGTILSGAMLPLALLPWGLGATFAWLPFASMASAPLRIYTGTGPPLPLVAVQAGWSLVLWPAAAWLFHASREKIVSHGG